MNQNTVTREVLLGQPVDRLVEIIYHKNEIIDELRSQKAALESEVKKEQRRIGAIFLEREDYRAQVAALEELKRRWNRAASKYACGSEFIDDPERVFAQVEQSLDLREKIRTKALESQLAEARRVLGIVAPYHEDCYCHDDDGLSGKCVHCVIIDAAGALRSSTKGQG